MAQLTALRIWTDLANNKNIAFHKTSHLEKNEYQAYSELHGLEAKIIETDVPITVNDLKNINKPIAALLTELPMRHYGGTLPSWEELCELKTYCAKNSIKLHMDGARLWETKPYYNRDYKEICDGFDSVYVSLYKGTGGLAGCMLLGDESFIDTARIWMRRMGGTLIQLHPFVVSAKMNFDKTVYQFDDWKKRALEIAKIINQSKNFRTSPHVPQVNMFHIHFNAPASKVIEARDKIAELNKLWIFGGCQDLTESPALSKSEVYIREQALDIDDQLLIDSFNKLDKLIS